MGVPFTVDIARITVLVPSTDKVDVVVLRLVEGPLWFVGATLADRLTIPLKPFRLVRVMVEVPCDPRLSVSMVGLSEPAMSQTLTVTVAE